MKLLQNFMTKMLLISIKSLFNEMMKLYGPTQIPVFLHLTDFNYQKFSRLVSL